MRKILFSVFLFFSKSSFEQAVTASFNAPDTVCVNAPVSIQNTSQVATNYFWSFCTANINQPPIGTNLGNPGNALSLPVYIDYVFTNGNYYGFVTNNFPGGLVRLDFGNSLLNTPAVTNLGNIGGAIPNSAEGVQIANDNGIWYVLVVGGEAASGSLPSLTTVSLGANIANNTPTATNWGNIGNLAYPHDLYVFNDNGHWYGLTANYSNNTFTRFDLTTNLSNAPSATNLGNIGNLSGPTGIQAINDNGNWRVFVTNATSSTLTRLDFGSSLLNSPTGINLGNPGNTFVTCWDIYILRYCGENEAFVINANGGYHIIKLDFGSSLANNPTSADLGNLGNLSFPHSLSKLFRVGADVFSLLTNVNNNTLTLLQFPGCTNASVPNSTAQNPPGIIYNTPGKYNISLTVDDGLPTQASYCKQVVVQNCDKIINDYTEILGFNICKNEITVADASKYNPGDTVLLIQMKGAIIDSSNTANFGTVKDYKNAGNYEYNYVKQKTGNVIQLKNLVTRQYDIPTGKVQLIRVPYFDNLTVNNRLTCLQWDGSKGGVLAFNVKNTLTMNADIDVTGKGFIGGRSLNTNSLAVNCFTNGNYYSLGSIVAAAKGESIYNLGDDKKLGKAFVASGAGGGSDHNSGGGGGGNGGQGGNGGYEVRGCGINFDNGGRGGNMVVYNNLNSKIFLGGGGGSGHANNSNGINMNGGNGGGIVIIKSDIINSNSYKIISKGSNGEFCDSVLHDCNDGNGGAGAGGAVLIDNTIYTSNTSIDVSGGKGANLTSYNPVFLRDKVGPGGGGGGGITWISNATTPVNLVENFAGGPNGVILSANSDPWGATPGTAGTNLFNLKIPIDTILFRPNIDSVRIEDSATSCQNFIFKGLGYTNTSAISSWKWSFGDGSSDVQQNTSHTFSVAGNYTVRLVVTDINGCVDSILKPLTTSDINITKSGDTSVCKTGSVQLLAAGGVSYVWAPASTLSNPTVSNPVATPLVTTTYHFTVTNAAGCSKTDSITVAVNSLPTISKSKDTGICNNTSVQLLVSGGSAYSWMPTSFLNNPNISNPIATPAATTTYYVTVTNSAGCSKMDSIKISTTAPPVISKSNDTSICKSTSVQLFATGGSTYVWSPASSLNNAGIPNPVATPGAPTTYYVMVTNNGGCSKTDSVKIGINPLAVIAKSNDTTICNQASVKIFASGGASYLWSPASSLDDPASSSPLASPVTTTLYKVAIKDAHSCNYEDSVKVSVRSAATFTVSPGGAVCSGSSKQLQASGGDTYVWSPADGLDNPNTNSPTATPVTSITYTVTIHENTCNETGTLSTNVTVLPLPDINATSSNDLTCSFGSSQLDATGATNYTWSPATGLNNSNIANPVATPSSTTVYKVVGKDGNGCENSDTVIVKADFNTNALYLLPNSFTPNGDGINDCFGVKYWGIIHELDFRIYNRFGEMVFHTNDPAMCWDGRYKQQLQDADVFVYTITARTACGLINRKGTIALLK